MKALLVGVCIRTRFWETPFGRDLCRCAVTVVSGVVFKFEAGGVGVCGAVLL